MCGIIAMISKTKYGFTAKDKEMFHQMLFANTLRGDDSTGIFGVTAKGNLDMIKSAKTAPEMQGTKRYADFLSDVVNKYRIVVGHNRASTRGATTDENAHPFIEDNICLVHNGTLYSHKELADKEVDSHAICHSIAQIGYKKTIEKINGAFALVWYDAKEKKLHIGRNTQRPLWIIQTETADYVASEPGMLEWLYFRNFSKTEKAKYFNTELLYTYDVDTLTEGYNNEPMPKKVQSVVTTSLLLPPTVIYSTKTTGHSSNENTFHGANLKQGDRVVFEHVSNSVYDKRITIVGKSVNLPTNYRVSAHITTDDMSDIELEYMLDTDCLLSGTYVGYTKLYRAGEYQLILNDIKVIKEYQSCNGHTVTLDQIANAGHCCHECGTIIEPEDDDGLFWVRMKKDRIKTIYCPTCVAQHPRLVKFLPEIDLCVNEW